MSAAQVEEVDATSRPATPTGEAIRAHARQVAAGWPALTAEQRTRLRALIGVNAA